MVVLFLLVVAVVISVVAKVVAGAAVEP